MSGSIWNPNGWINTAFASLISFLQGGVGAIVRTVQDKLRETVSLEDFGAVGDGVTDDSAATHAACVYCYQSGATLRLAGGKTYKNARLEWHGSFNIEGNGARVKYFGVGTTLIYGIGSGTACVPTAWPNDPSYDPEGNYNTVMYSLTGSLAVGAATVAVTDSTGIVVGDILFIGGEPTSASSQSNYIPRDFEFVQVRSIAGNVLTLNGKLKNAYAAAAAMFKSAGIAKNCSASDIVIDTTEDAYQLVIRSSYNVCMENITFAGDNTVGAATFSQGLQMTNFAATGAAGNFSFARGLVSGVLDGFIFQYKAGMGTEPNCIFVEESFYNLTFNRINSFGGSLSVRQLDMNGTTVKRSVLISDSVFDCTNSPIGATSPFQCGTVAGADIESIGVTYIGGVSTPNTSSYPGIAGDALMWISANQPTDKLKFTGCTIISTNTGACFRQGGGALGSALFDEMTTVTTCDAPITQHTPRGAWISMAGGLLNGFSVAAGSVAQYRMQDKNVHFKGRLNLNGAAAGSNFYLMQAGARPLTEVKEPAATDTTSPAILRVTAAGDAFYVGSAVVPTYIQLDTLSYPIDA